MKTTKNNGLSDYQKGKAKAIDRAIAWQREASKMQMSYGELYAWCDYWYKVAKRYGLIKEFRQNGII